MGIARTFLGGALLCGCGGGDGDKNTTFSDESSGSQTGDTVADSNDSQSESTEDGTDDGMPKLDVSGMDDGNCQGPPECGEVEFSYLWVANAPQSTVSKINTQTLQEEGRYWTREDHAGNPSRTSVNVTGRAVAVANRFGGVIKIWANEADCVDQNGAPGIQTSQGKNDVLDWEDDDCVAWFTPMTYTTQRPIAWGAGEVNPDTCEYENERVWVAGGTGQGLGGCNGGPTMVHRLDGESGDVVDTVEVDEVACTSTGPYGAAVDGAGDLWVSSRPETRLIQVDGDSLDYTVHEWADGEPGGPYGITVDSQGRVWVTLTSQFGAIAGRYSPDTETWDFVDEEIQSIGGVAETEDGRMWIARYDPLGTEGFHVVDSDTLELYDFVPSPDGDVVKGISADVDGYVWVVTYSNAFKFDPDDYSSQSYGGLDEPYTYSDMTGHALFNAACPDPG